MSRKRKSEVKKRMDQAIGFKASYIYHILFGAITYVSKRNNFTEHLIIRLYGEDSIKNFPKLNRNVLFKNMLFDINPKDVNVLKEEYNNNFRLHQLYDLFEDKSVCDLKFGLYLKLDQESKDYISKFDTLLSRGDLVAIIFSNFLLSLSDMQYDLLFDVFRFLKEDEQYVNMLKK